MLIYCPHCSQEIAIELDLIGSRGQCPRCEQKFLIQLEHQREPFHDTLGSAPTIKMEEGDFAWGVGNSSSPETEPTRRALLGVVLLTALLLVGVAGLAWWASGASALPRWAIILGKLHQLIVHSPAVLLGVVLLMDVLGGRRELTHLRESSRFLFWVTLVILLFASLSGILLRYALPVSDEGLIDRHLWLGLTSSLLAMIAMVLRITCDQNPYFARWIYQGVLLFSAGGLALTALTSVSKSAQSVLTSVGRAQGPGWEGKAVGDERSLYQAAIVPIIQGRCVECHGGETTEGGLRLDSYADLMEGGVGGVVVFPGNVEISPLYLRTVTSEMDEDFMPKGREPLTDEEVTLLAHWIERGASQDGTIKEAGLSPELMEVVDELAGEETASKDRENHRAGSVGESGQEGSCRSADT